MINLSPLPFDLPAVARKKLTVDFDGGNQSSDGGVLLLRAAERRVGIIARLAAALPDRRDPARIRHRLDEIIGARVFGICCGWEDAIDHNRLRHDPALKNAVARTQHGGFAGRSALFQRLARPTTPLRTEILVQRSDSGLLHARWYASLGMSV